MTQKKRLDTKFLFLRNGNEGTLIAEDGGVMGFHNNQEHIVGTSYGRINLKELIKTNLNTVLDKLWNSNEKRYLLDFENEDYITMSTVIEGAEWLICPIQGTVFDNLTFMEEKKLTKKILVNFLNKV